ncbi:MAG: transporter substrate-binding domain-containing protein [Acutalibacteraceae bacterium]|nr:transporter substrate-binding domain-containing protein [Acutalibacteraceae bacterium]
MKKILALVLAGLMLFSFAACGGNNGGTTEPTDNQAAAVDGDLKYIKDKGTLVVGITDYAPMDFKDENGEWTGFDAEFARLTGEKLGVEVEFIEIDWDNKFFELDAKSIDCIWNGMTITTEAKENASVSNAYVKNAQVVVMKSADLANFATAESLATLDFAVEAGSAGEEAAKENSLDYTAVLTQADALKEVKSGAADACIIDITMADAMTGEGTSYANLGYSLELTSEEYGIACRKDSNLTAAINDIMAELKADGTLQGLAEKYELTLA